MTPVTSSRKSSRAAAGLGPAHLAALLLALAGCGGGDARPLRIGFMICNSVAETRARFAPLAAHLAEQLAANPVSAITAALNGSVNPNGLLTNYWFVWGTDPNLTIPALTHETQPQVLQAGTFSAQAVSAPLVGLSVGVTYYFRVVAGNTEGQSQGTIRSFTTFVPPTVNTDNATSITTTGALLNGDVNPNGYLTEAWFEHGTDPTLSSFQSTFHQSNISGTSPVSFSESISGLNPWSTYWAGACLGRRGCRRGKSGGD